MKNENNHVLIMALACGSALLLIFLLPLFGLSKNLSFGIAIAVMIGLHLLFMHNSNGYRRRKHRGKNE